jgi:hypothetical protein
MNNQLDQLAFSFFKLFTQYESSLKEKGFFVSGGKKVIVDWDRFANEVIGNNFIDDLGDKAEFANYILSKPPKRQNVNENGNIVWQVVSNENKSVQSLFGHISRVRNNLYHGAKFNDSWFDPDRSKRLLESSLEILERFKEKIML